MRSCDSDMSPEQLLWQKVVERAVIDAVSHCRKMSKDGTISEAWWDKHHANKWLIRNSRDFRDVCEMAGFDPDFIRESYISGKLHGMAETRGYSRVEAE